MRREELMKALPNKHKSKRRKKTLSKKKWRKNMNSTILQTAVRRWKWQQKTEMHGDKWSVLFCGRRSTGSDKVSILPQF